MTRQNERVGLWMIGAGGSVASTVALGIAAIRKGRCSKAGLVTCLDPFRDAALCDPGAIVLGGHEIRPITLVQAIQESHRGASLFDERILRTANPQLRAWQRNIKRGTLCGTGPALRKLIGTRGGKLDRSPAAAVERLTADIVEFRRRHGLGCVVVVHLASSEPQFRPTSTHSELAALRRAMSRPGSRAVPASTIYALSAIEAGCPYINFTPSSGICVPAVRRYADRAGIPYMGNDGKTGETLVKSALAPMFSVRNLPILSWVGQNILGNRDGEVLVDPATRRAKVRSKDKAVSHILGYKPVTGVSIDYVPSLDDWKVAWDFIHFEGFLGTRMNMQFTWQGSDSVLAAPLVIDLTRLAALAHRFGESGPMKHLAFFFKDPIEGRSHALPDQWRGLVDYVSDRIVGK